MLTVSLHGIRIHAPIGMYAEEKITGNDFEIDVDVYVPVNDAQPWPFVDYSLINDTVANVFQQPGEMLETFAQLIHRTLKEQVPFAEKIKVAIRKMHPPMEGDIAYAQVCYED